MRLRRPRTLVVTFADSTAVLHNFLTRRSIPCDDFAMRLLTAAEQWRHIDEFAAMWPSTEHPALMSYLAYLSEQSFLVVEGTPLAEIDADYESSWSWQETAGFYHFGMKDPDYLQPAQAYEWLEHRAVTQPVVEMYKSNNDCDVVKQLPKPDLSDGLLGTMSRRRSIRGYVPGPMPLEALRDCLFAGLGITGFLDTKVTGDAAMIPLKMTPSGGGRNPYEAYVWALRVEDLPYGIYHYSAIENSLGLVTTEPPVSATELLVGQYWAEDAQAIILLVANFERTSWKYVHPTAYRVVLLEAGHIGQNIALAATSHNMSATPTAALNDSAAQRLLDLNWIKQSLVYALLIGIPHPQSQELLDSKPHLAG